MEPILSLLIAIIVIVVVLWLVGWITAQMPIPPMVRSVLLAVIGLLLLYWFLERAGLV